MKLLARSVLGLLLGVPILIAACGDDEDPLWVLDEVIDTAALQTLSVSARACDLLAGGFGIWDSVTGECSCPNGGDIANGCQTTSNPPGNPPGGGGTSGDATSVSVTCTPSVERAKPVTCTASGNGDFIVESWHANSQGHKVDVTRSDLTWTGNVVTNGFVYVMWSPGSGGVQAQSSSGVFSVTERGWSWGETDWTHDRHGKGSTGMGDDEPFLNAVLTLGRLCPIGSGCTTTNPFLQPDNYRTGTNGYSIAPVNDGAMQDGLFYVTGASFRFETASAVNKGITLQSGHVKTLTDSADVAACTNRGQTLQKNYFLYNSACAGLDPLSVIFNVLDHEEGHHLLGEAVAPQSDPESRIEALFDSDSGALKNRVVNNLNAVNSELLAAMVAAEPASTAVVVWRWGSNSNKFWLSSIGGGA